MSSFTAGSSAPSKSSRRKGAGPGPIPAKTSGHCKECNQTLPKASFSPSQWKKETSYNRGGGASCTSCINKRLNITPTTTTTSPKPQTELFYMLEDLMSTLSVKIQIVENFHPQIPNSVADQKARRNLKAYTLLTRDLLRQEQSGGGSFLGVDCEGKTRTCEGGGGGAAVAAVAMVEAVKATAMRPRSSTVAIISSWGGRGCARAAASVDAVVDERPRERVTVCGRTNAGDDHDAAAHRLRPPRPLRWQRRT